MYFISQAMPLVFTKCCYFKRCHNELTIYATFSCIQQEKEQQQCVAFQEGQVKTNCALQTML